MFANTSAEQDDGYGGGQEDNAIAEDSLDILDGLRRMEFSGLKAKDREPEVIKAAASHQPCKCFHGNEECCEFETHEKADLLEYFQAPAAIPTYHKAQYCISGDEPACDHLRKEEQLKRSHQQQQ